MTQPNPTPTIPMNLPAKHDIHKFRDIRPKLRKDNWISWKRELLATARDCGLYATITGRDTLSILPMPTPQLTDEWNDRNNAAYNQILLCISPELQTAIDDTEYAAEAWRILMNKFESHDPSKISISTKTSLEKWGK